MVKPFVLAALMVSVGSITSLEAFESPPVALQDRWVAPALQLGAESFSQRRAARRQLEIAGAGASAALGEAVLHGNREAARGAYALLSQRLQSTSPALQASSKSALHAIAGAKHSLYSARALKLLETEEAFQRRAFHARDRPTGALPTFLQGVDAIAFQVRNGNQELRIDEASRRVTIHRSPGGALTIQIVPLGRVAPAGNGEEPQVVSAKNPDELRTSDPKMYALYRRFAPLLSRRPALAHGAPSEVATH